MLNRLGKIFQDPKNKEQLHKFKEMAPLYQKHQFWDTQPVPHILEEQKLVMNSPIETKEVKDVRSMPLNLPDGFEWANVDLENEKEVEEVL
jgi:hypothetical protein